MDLEHFRKVLLAKEKELTGEIARLSGDARYARTAEVEDPMDQVTSDQGEATALEETSNLSDTLSQVRAALQRLHNGEYGRCVDCGREIKLARLEAVPWTPYCIDDQQKHDNQRRVNTPSL
ncbi:MAG: TraR/DksA family transcriptional regulator [Acidobacteriaceae bacterium]|nr:TraR/DksA family transcriptional regulator [Acidobacteriaceae bacterium]MBV8573263.1 TraR/DksA family transcriptional regulator [Acidobacteriaceae bacterium]